MGSVRRGPLCGEEDVPKTGRETSRSATDDTCPLSKPLTPEQTQRTLSIGIKGVAVTKKGPVGYSYLVKGDGRNFKKDERVQRRYERLYYALWLEVT